jgi:hypothetical protein
MRLLSLGEGHARTLQSRIGQIATPPALSAEAGQRDQDGYASEPSAANQETEIAGLSRGAVLLVSGGVVAGNTVI